ncbi:MULTISPECIES: copper-containing nitrite reductase [unclassified Bosea (in: a-proteobacteria)]|uniref:copper-containing nitrite reductase n=1 Tax=unclassified Bosea (in: a-proteobacteria) TaxID=2653178 RepID=UPI000954F3DA|nr:MULTISPECIES: copper-containing nitrite reductase [unclassified Bosea (in: a-proteobacteria)]TAJ27645.1 MAG: nitrite reductase, copper-containing [Bosea sp. (in: a-proteobacteria)]SIR26567.1 dissimilatory nitrite reductase (NO-forming), copper type apoprotein [Bosea sp. TND4EK4]
MGQDRKPGESLTLTRRSILAGAAATGAIAQAAAPAQAQAVMTKVTAEDIAKLPRVKQKLVDPPFVHPHEQIATGGPKVIEFEMTIHEKKIVLDDAGTETFAFTFNGTVPGPLMVVHEGDYVELTLINADTNELMHNIDFHASTGALGGGALTEVSPGERVVLRFKATRPGVFVYHCAPPGMVPWHVTAGMNGALMVLPRDGLKDGQGKALKYDKVYYVGEQDFYVPRDETGKFKRYASPGDAHEDVVKAMRTLTPSHIVFNGKVGALTGKNALTSKVGETVLVVHSQANRDTRPHLIGGHGDYVWATGKFRNPPERDLETWFIPGGCAGAALYTFLQPGIYAYVNHNLIEAFELGAAGHFKVEGQWNDDLMKQIKAPAGI